MTRAARLCTLRSRVQAPLCSAFTGPRQMRGRLNSAFRPPAARRSLRKPCQERSTGGRCSQSDALAVALKPQRNREGTPATQISLGDRLTVGQVPLTHSVQVRILVAQPRVDAKGNTANRRLVQASNLGNFWRQQLVADVGRILDFAEPAAMGMNLEVQKHEV